MKKIISMALLAFTVIAGPGLIFSHEGSFKDPDTIPPFGPHGGRTLKLTRHFAEVSVKAKTVEVYILERDVKTVASDASGVTLNAAVPGNKSVVIPLTKKGDGYAGNYAAPSTARRILFTVSCVLDGKKETGTMQYEIKK